MTNIEAFRCLGIPMAKDSSEIKKAYQKLLPRNHPEENPEGFMRLHDAYKTALAYAKGTDSTFSNTFSRQPENRKPAREETTYDSLFSDLDEKPRIDYYRAEQEFIRKVRRLRLSWLPIPQRRWHRFFGSEAFLVFRDKDTYLSELYELIERKIHSYRVFCFLLNQLWELETWQTSENLRAEAARTRQCIQDLKKHYPHYGRMNAENPVKRWLYPAYWYYQALPFYFKLPVSLVAFPLLSFGPNPALGWMLAVFYFLEANIAISKKRRDLGIFRPIPWTWRGTTRYKTRSDNAFLVVGTIYAILAHVSFCISFAEKLVG